MPRSSKWDKMEPMAPKSVLALKSIPTFEVLNQTFPGLKAIFFDMDGSLFDTEIYHTEAMLKLGRDYQIRPPVDPSQIHGLMHGKADYLVFDIIKDWPGFPKEWKVQDFVNEKNKNLLEILEKLEPGVYFPHQTFELIKKFKAQGLFMALVTSSERVITLELLKLVGLTQFFNLVLTRDDCPKHKPDPWPYLHAMSVAHSDAHSSLIFEDSNVGLTSAEASGSHVVKVEWF
jgi:HAD superfamily hydrolase (TIGR01509 family)